MYITVVLYGAAWVPGGVVNIFIFTVIQRIMPKEMLGRVFSVVSSLSGIAMPIGSLAGGIAGVHLGSDTVILLSGLIVVAVAVIWLLDPVIRKIPATSQLNEQTLSLAAK